MTIDWNKPLQDIEGNRAELVKILTSNEKYKYMCVVKDIDGLETGYIVDAYGGTYDEHVIENVPVKKKKVWVNLYKNNALSSLHNYEGFVSNTREQADSDAGEDRIACVEIEVDE